MRPFVDERGTAAAADPAIRGPAHGKCAGGVQEVGPRGDGHHRPHREAARLDEIERQPGDDEVVPVVRGKVPESGTPELAALQNPCEGRMRVGGGSGCRLPGICRLAGDRPAPRPKPCERQRTEDDEHGPPTELRHEITAEQRPDGGPEQIAEAQQAVGNAQPTDLHRLREHLRGAGKGHALADTEQHAQCQQGGETAREAGAHRRDRPEGDTGCQHPLGSEALRQPSHGGHAEDIAIIESRQQNPELARAQMQLVLHHRSGRRKVAAIDVVDEYGRRHQQYEARGRRCLTQKEVSAPKGDQSTATTTLPITDPASTAAWARAVSSRGNRAPI